MVVQHCRFWPLSSLSQTDDTNRIRIHVRRIDMEQILHTKHSIFIEASKNNQEKN